MKRELKYIYTILVLILFPFFLKGKEREKINTILNCKTEKIEEMESTIKSHGELIYKIHEELLENKQEIDTLRGKIQEIQHETKNKILEK